MFEKEKENDFRVVDASQALVKNGLVVYDCRMHADLQRMKMASSGVAHCTFDFVGYIIKRSYDRSLTYSSSSVSLTRLAPMPPSSSTPQNHWSTASSKADKEHFSCLAKQVLAKRTP